MSLDPEYYLQVSNESHLIADKICQHIMNTAHA